LLYIGCQCPQCVCVECLKKMQQGDFQVSAKQVLGGKPEESKRGPNCTCEHCICIDCGGKTDFNRFVLQCPRERIKIPGVPLTEIGHLIHQNELK